MSALEKRITAALADDAVTASDLAALVVETTDAMAAADEAAEAERTRALDLALSPDPAKARAAMEDAVFTRDRLRTVLPKLQVRHAKQQRVEQKTKWVEQYDEMVPGRDALAKELTEVYDIVPKLVDVLCRCREFDAEIIRRVRDAKPYPESGEPHDGRDLREVELVARNVNDLPRGFSLYCDLVLLDFAKPGERLWPPGVPTLAAEYARQMMAANHMHIGDKWWENDPAAIERHNAMNDEAIAQAKARAKEREERDNAEANKRAQEAIDAVRRAAGWPR